MPTLSSNWVATLELAEAIDGALQPFYVQLGVNSREKVVFGVNI